MRACKRDTPPSSPPCGVRSTSGKILLTASSRPIIMLSLPLRSNSELSASTIKRADNAVGAAGTAVTTSGSGAAAGAGAGAAAGTALASTAAGAGPPSILTPQFEQKASPAGFCAPHDGQVCVPTATAGALGAG